MEEELFVIEVKGDRKILIRVKNRDVEVISIPDGIREIGAGAFNFCDSLMSIEIPDSVMEIGEEAFWGCSSLTSIEIPNSVKKIGAEAFCDCNYEA